jgi:hypothetical protein
MPAETYEDVTQEMFDEKLNDVVYQKVLRQDISVLMGIPGIYEILSEYYNNDVLEALKPEED